MYNSLNMSHFEILKDEQSIGKEINRALTDPIRLFAWKADGENQEGFLSAFEGAFENIPWDDYFFRQEQLMFLESHLPEQKKTIDTIFKDYYYFGTSKDVVEKISKRLPTVEHQAFLNIIPDRKRTISYFSLKADQSKWRVQEIEKNGFKQKAKAQDFRQYTRKFERTSEAITTHRHFHELLQNIGDLVKSVAPDVSELEICFHQVSILAFPSMPGDNAPEGIHKDGADYIISALIIEKSNITGGASIVYDKDMKTPLFSTNLTPGQGLFQADLKSPYYHDVTPIHLSNEKSAKVGVRNLFGFDIHVVK